MTCMHTYTILTAGDSVWPPCSQIRSQRKQVRRWTHQSHAAWSLQSVTEAYVQDRSAGVSKHISTGISHGLHDILQPGINIVQVTRQAAVDAGDLSATLQELPNLKSLATCNAQPSSVQSAAEALLSYFPSNPHTKILLADIQQVIQHFLDVSGFEAIDASLSVITTTSCPRFHADHVQLRCLCTYVGPGTYFVPNKAVKRRQWMRALGIQNTNGFGVKSQSSIQQASAWDIVILKGNSFPGNQGAGAVHKSPAASQEHPRLVLTLDEARQPCHCGHNHSVLASAACTRQTPH